MANANPLDSLDRVDELTKESVKLADSKKYMATKRKIKSICTGLTKDTKDYRPEKSLENIDIYVNTKDKMARILYSEISNYLFNLEQDKRVVFLTNVEKMLIYSLGKEDIISDDVAKIVVKIYDHTQLVNYQIENMNDTFAQRIADAKVDLHSEIKGVEKEYITILGIFAAIVLAFVGTFTFSTSVLNNVTNTNAFKLVVIASVIGLVFFNLVGLLIDFLREINDKKRSTDDVYAKKYSMRKLVNIVLLIIILTSLVGYGITKVTFPETVFIGTPQQEVQTYLPATEPVAGSGE